MLAFATALLAAAGSPELHVGAGQDFGTLDEALQAATTRVSTSAHLTVHLHGSVLGSKLPLVLGPEHSHLTIVGGTVSGGIRVEQSAWKSLPVPLTFGWRQLLLVCLQRDSCMSMVSAQTER